MRRVRIGIRQGRLVPSSWDWTLKGIHSMKLSVARITKRAAPDAPKGRVFALPCQRVPVITVEDRAQLETAAKRRNDKGRYTVFREP